MAASVTNREIARYWKRKRLVEEDHLFAAMKAAARVRARNLSVEDYLQFEYSLREEGSSRLSSRKGNMKAVTGIKDWWTKSKYAYLNQPALGSLDSPPAIASLRLSHFTRVLSPQLIKHGLK